MIQFLTTTETTAQIQRVMRNAEKEITLISPYLKLSRDWGERLISAEGRGVRVRLAYGKKRDIEETTKERFAELDGLEVFYYEHLHAKCYFNEERLVLTSMNLYDYSARNNREMGIVATSEEKVYREARREGEDIVRRAERVSALSSSPAAGETSGRGNVGGGRSGSLEALLGGGKVRSEDARQGGGKTTSASAASRSANGKRGFCIRKRERIPYDPKRPLCRSCYRKWAEWEDPTYEENYCHRCGGKAEEVHTSGALSMERPECLDCYRKRRAEEKA